MKYFSSDDFKLALSVRFIMFPEEDPKHLGLGSYFHVNNISGMHPNLVTLHRGCVFAVRLSTAIGGFLLYYYIPSNGWRLSNGRRREIIQQSFLR